MYNLEVDSANLGLTELADYHNDISEYTPHGSRILESLLEDAQTSLYLYTLASYLRHSLNGVLRSS
jgi:hypothetical protein